MSSPIMSLTPQQNFPAENIQSTTEAFYNSRAFMANEIQFLATMISIIQKGFEQGQQQLKDAANGQS